MYSHRNYCWFRTKIKGRQSDSGWQSKPLVAQCSDSVRLLPLLFSLLYQFISNPVEQTKAQTHSVTCLPTPCNGWVHWDDCGGVRVCYGVSVSPQHFIQSYPIMSILLMGYIIFMCTYIYIYIYIHIYGCLWNIMEIFACTRTLNPPSSWVSASLNCISRLGYRCVSLIKIALSK